MEPKFRPAVALDADVTGRCGGQPVKSDSIIDCLIVGGGPAGLMAATYLGRYRRSVVLVDAGESQAASFQKAIIIPAMLG